MARCKVADCPRPATARGYCAMHYQRWRRHGDPLTVLVPHGKRRKVGPCQAEGCSEVAYARGYCPRHYQRHYHTGDAEYQPGVPRVPCAVAECAQRARARGWCAKHYARWRKWGDPRMVRGKREATRSQA